jgi:hypothetical protein
VRASTGFPGSSATRDAHAVIPDGAGAGRRDDRRGAVAG